jgi:uncharacterized protein (TIGR03435 family)
MTAESLSPIWADGVPALCNHLWQSTLFLGIVALLALLLRKNQARIRYWLWMTASAKFLIPFSLLVSLGSHLPWPNHAVAPKTSAYVAIEEVSQPFLEATALKTPIAIPIAKSTDSHVPIAILPLGLAAVWLTGFITMMSFWSVQWWRIFRLVRSATPLIEGREVDLLRKVEKLARLPRSVPLLPSGNSMEPGVFGIIRPVLLWPEGIARHMDDAHLESVLAHEVCHVQRRDNLTSAIHMLVEAIFWFHPMVWWIERQLVKERERACDEAVLQLGNEAEVYAESILNVCKFYTEPSIACVSGVTGSELKQRIARILSGQGVRKLDLRRKAMLALASVLAVSVPLAAGFLRAAQGQTQPAQGNGVEKSGIAGTWQGTEHTPEGHALRVVLKIAKDEKGALSATLYSLDRKGPPMAGSSVSFEKGTLRFENDFPRLTYDGKISTDGNSISGTVTQFGSFPLVLVRATPGTEWATPAAPPSRIVSMATDAKPGVEVATIKPIQPGTTLVMLLMQGEHLVVKNISLKYLIQFAYDMPDRQIAGAPGWTDTEKWNIEAKPDTPGMPSIPQMRLIVQSLLAERFALKSHEEKQKMAAFALTVGNKGPKMTKTADTSESPNFVAPLGMLDARSSTMGEFAHFLQSSVLGRPVVDNTGLTGRWDFTLKWTPDETQFTGPGMKVPPQTADDANGPPPLLTAIQEQLGLKLQAEKADVLVLVVDHVDHPSPN